MKKFCPFLHDNCVEFCQLYDAIDGCCAIMSIAKSLWNIQREIEKGIEDETEEED